VSIVGLAIETLPEWLFAGLLSGYGVAIRWLLTWLPVRILRGYCGAALLSVYSMVIGGLSPFRPRVPSQAPRRLMKG